MPVCGVCAIGAVFVATVRRFNQLTLRELDEQNRGYRGELTDYLERFFDANQLNLMEWAFEGSHIEGNDYDYCGYESAIIAFHRQYEDDNARLVAIFENIIKNKGRFVLDWEDPEVDDDRDDDEDESDDDPDEEDDVLEEGP
jgi:hypothetical protein